MKDVNGMTECIKRIDRVKVLNDGATKVKRTERRSFMKPYAILRDLFAALLFIGLMCLINSVEPLPAAIFNIASGAFTAKTALVVLAAIFVASRMAAYILKGALGWRYGLAISLRRYL